MDHQFKRLLNLVRRTGDRLVVTDQNGEDTYVLMGLEAYEKISVPEPEEPWSPPHFDRNGDFVEDYSEDEDEYDEEISDNEPKWKIPDEFYAKPSITSESPASDIWSAMPPAGDNSQTWNAEKFGEAEKKIVAEKFGQAPQAPLGAVEEINPPSPSQTPSGVVEEVKKPDENNDIGEEQFYLEPVE